MTTFKIQMNRTFERGRKRIRKRRGRDRRRAGRGEAREGKGETGNLPALT